MPVVRGADTLTIACDNEYFQIKGTQWHGRTLHDLYQEAYTPWEWHAPLKAEAERLGIDFFSTPFDPSAVAFLACLEAVSALLRTEGGSPGVVPYEAKLSVSDRATRGCAVPGILRTVAHFCLLWPLRA